MTHLQLWEQKYLHSEWQEALAPETTNEQPCPDVYWFPLMSETMCQHLIEEMEHFGRWSGGKNDVSMVLVARGLNYRWHCVSF